MGFAQAPDAALATFNQDAAWSWWMVSVWFMVGSGIPCHGFPLDFATVDLSVSAWAAHRFARHSDLSGRHGLEAGDEADERTLARSRGANHDREAARLQAERARFYDRVRTASSPVRLLDVDHFEARELGRRERRRGKPHAHSP